MEEPVIQCRTEIIHSSAQEPAGIFKRRREARAAGRKNRTTLRAVAAEAGNQRVRVEIPEAVSSRCGNERLVVLRRHRIEIFFRRRIDGARLVVVDSEIQTETIPDLEWIAAEYVKTGTLLLEVQTIFKAQSLRQLGRIHSEKFARLIVAEARLEYGKSRRERPV